MSLEPPNSGLSEPVEDNEVDDELGNLLACFLVPDDDDARGSSSEDEKSDDGEDLNEGQDPGKPVLLLLSHAFRSCYAMSKTVMCLHVFLCFFIIRLYRF